MKIQAGILVCALSMGAYCQGWYPAPPEPKTSEFGIVGGWGSPVGDGIEYSYFLTESNNLGVGLGFSFSGLKYEFGYKHIFLAENFFAPYVGVNFGHSGGLSPVTVRIDNDSAQYRINDAYLVHPRLGGRLKMSFVRLYANTGYGFVTSGGGTKYLRGDSGDRLKNLSKIFAAGGFELSFGLMLAF